jgi:hypothetical protein
MLEKALLKFSFRTAGAVLAEPGAALAEDAAIQTRLLVNNPREAGYLEALAICERAL